MTQGCTYSPSSVQVQRDSDGTDYSISLTSPLTSRSVGLGESVVARDTFEEDEEGEDEKSLRTSLANQRLGRDEDETSFFFPEWDDDLPFSLLQ